IFPTFMSFADISIDKGTIDGDTIVEMITKNGKSPHDQVFWEYNDQLAVRQGKWKLVLNGKLDFEKVVEDTVHLSNLEEDPSERNNLAAQYPELVAQMKADLHEWYESV